MANITILGLGYVGSVSAACLARLGHQVTGVDRDEHKVRSLRQGQAPFYEPGLAELIAEGVRDGRLAATTSTAEALASADIAFVCVGTPSQANGNLSLEQLQRVLVEVQESLAHRSHPLILVIRSTVFPGTGDQIVAPALAGSGSAMVRLVSNPEFLREGSAVRDFLEPSLLVVGGEDRAAVEAVAQLYAPLGVEACLVSLRTAEMIKYACNAFHALKVAFANEIGSLAVRLEVDPMEVMHTLCQDRKLNVSAAYLKPGFAFGGSCLPKDLRALVYRASRLDLKLPLLEATLPSNEEHLRRAMQAILRLPAARIGVVGLAFKENTDDVRESPVVALLEVLTGKGRDVRVFDPHISLEALHGSNRNFIVSTIPHIGRLLAPDLASVLTWADHIVLAQKQKPAVMAAIEERGVPVTDLVNALAL
ncbi:MAG: nucleotide sugar dehydrogenase [Bryobacteraceae bacterium]|nr:nucleotide sugar dehydrogenase [Bryobacteraceae bacterium]